MGELAEIDGMNRGEYIYIYIYIYIYAWGMKRVENELPAATA
jgi:hypothetical protein